VKVTGEALLTIEPGTTIQFAENTSFLVLDGGRLSAEGTSDEPITLTGQEEVPSYWKGLQFNGTKSNDNKLDQVVIEYGGKGAPGSGSKLAAVDLNTWKGPVRVAIDNTTIRHSNNYGLRVADDVTIRSFDGNTITNNKTAALTMGRTAPTTSSNT
jgi:hypothetical protein